MEEVFLCVVYTNDVIDDFRICKTKEKAKEFKCLKEMNSTETIIRVDIIKEEVMC